MKKGFANLQLQRVERPGALVQPSALAVENNSIAGLVILMTALFLGGCAQQVPEGALVLTERPVNVSSNVVGESLLDQRYPPGSRVVLVSPPYRPTDVRVLSAGLIAAGDVVVCPTRQCVVFAGKAGASSSWQIYEARLTGGRPRRLTSMEKGAMNPAIIANGDVVFSSPVPSAGGLCSLEHPPALYAVHRGGEPQRLTFAKSAAVEPTVLRDGRILFVSADPAGRECAETASFALFTINSDGTELTRFALDHDGASLVRRPRELPGGRIGFLAAPREHPEEFRAETVRTARPFASRAPLLNSASPRCTSVAADGDRSVLICAEARGLMGRSMEGSIAVFRLPANAERLDAPVFLEPGWDVVEAAAVKAVTVPTGHISAMVPGKKTGTILCLNANFTRSEKGNSPARSLARRIRVIVDQAGSSERVLGEIALQTDGSFMVEVPADTPLGFETLDDQGRVLQRLPPALWVRPGENRSCLGCHEPYNHSPRNVRPLAATAPPVALRGEPQTTAPSKP